MAINVYRSPRAIDFSHRSTADKVGPGTYSNTHNEVTRAFEEKGVPFQSLQEKDLCQNKNTSAITPGPGAYIDPDDGTIMGVPVGKRQTSVFKSVSRRMCPTAPGSSTFLPSTIVENPGPGSYALSKTWSKDKKLAPKEHQPPVLELAHTVPSIPAQKVPPGGPSANDKKDAEMAGVRMKHTGEKKDTVGPAEYEVRGRVTQKDPQSVNFHSSASNRRLFEPSSFIDNKLPSRQNPGPGTYEYAKEKIDPVDTLSAGGGSQHYMFASKTPMSHEIQVKQEVSVPGPGAYKTEAESKIAREQAGVKSQFGSTVDRRGWSRPMNQPFTDPYHLKVPGPGHYPDPKGAFITPRKASVDPDQVVDRKRFFGVHHPSQIMALQETQGPLHAFHSTDIRPCNRKVVQSTPAPGEYNNEDSLGFSITSVLKEKATVGKKGVFGSTAGRFDRSSVFSGRLDGSSVDAGKYDVADKGKSEEAPRSMFQSQSPRFRPGNDVKGDGGFGDTYAVPVGKRQGPGPADYINNKEVNYRSPFRHPRREHLSFGAGRQRFDAKEIFCGQQYNLNPGPGDYNPARRRGFAGSANTKAGRALAATVGCTGNDVGPGSYDTGGTLLKKTFNVSTEQPADLLM